jgi:hypothetical protein
MSTATLPAELLHRRRLLDLHRTYVQEQLNWEALGQPHQALIAWAKACRIERQLGNNERQTAP